MECTLHCHSHNLVFVHIYTPKPLRGLRIFVHKIATLQYHSMHFNIFILRNIHSNNTSRTCIIYALCWACKLINWYKYVIFIFKTIFGFWNRINSFTRYIYIYKYQLKTIFTIWQQKSINRYVYIVKLVFPCITILANFICLLMIWAIQVEVWSCYDLYISESYITLLSHRWSR